MWQAVYDELKNAGLNPFPPGKYVGECKERYCVVKEQTQSAYFNARSVGYRLIDLILFVPASSYIAMGVYAAEIKTAMLGLKPNVRPTGTETPVITDDDRKAYTTSLEYVVMKRLEV